MKKGGNRQYPQTHYSQVLNFPFYHLTLEKDMVTHSKLKVEEFQIPENRKSVYQ